MSPFFGLALDTFKVKDENPKMLLDGKLKILAANFFYGGLNVAKDNAGESDFAQGIA